MHSYEQVFALSHLDSYTAAGGIRAESRIISSHNFPTLTMEDVYKGRPGLFVFPQSWSHHYKPLVYLSDLFKFSTFS